MKIRTTTGFRKDLKRLDKRGWNLSLLSNIVKMIATGKEIPERYRVHALSGNYAGLRECHILSDWLLIYKINKEDDVLYLARTGSHSHSDLF